jgi:predicted transcriptional regulator
LSYTRLRTEEEARYPLVGNGVQARIMTFVHQERRPVSRAKLAERLGSSRGRISTEVGRLVENGLLEEEGLAESEGGAAPLSWAYRVRRAS